MAGEPMAQILLREAGHWPRDVNINQRSEHAHGSV
jgi:hypothetical protein